MKVGSVDKEWGRLLVSLMNLNRVKFLERDSIYYVV